MRPAVAQPLAAAWTGASPVDPVDYDLAGNWIDIATGRPPQLPPDSTSATFFDARAGQAPRDQEGNVVVSLGSDDLGARTMGVQALPFRFLGGGTLTIGELASPGQGTLRIQEGGGLTLDEATFDVRDSVVFTGGSAGANRPSSLTVLADGNLVVGDAIQLSATEGSLLSLLGGTIRATRIDTGFDSEQFQWTRGQLSFDEFRGDLVNPGGALNPGVGAAVATIDGSYQQEANARLNMQIGGTTLGETYDHLNVGGTLSAGGTLAVSLVGGFVPQAGDEFDLLNFETLSGTFENVILPGLPTGLEWDVSQLHAAGIVRVVRPGVPVTPSMWVGAAGDGDYFNPANWMNGIVPMNVENANFAVNVPGGANVSFAGQQVVVTGFTLAGNGTFNVTDNGMFEVDDNATIAGILSVAGPGSSFITGDSPTALVGAPQLSVSQGGLLQLAAEQFQIMLDPGTRVLMSSTDPGSLLDLSTLQQLSVGVGTNNTYFVAANNGGDIDLTGLTDVSGVTSGLGRLVLSAASGGTLHFGDLDVSNRTNLEATGDDTMIDVGGDLTINAASRLVLTGGATLQLDGNLQFSIVNADDFSADEGTLHFAGTGQQMLEVGGQDMGDLSQGGPMSGNFGAGQLLVGQPGAATTLILTDLSNNGGGNSPEALYLFGLGTENGLSVLEGATFMPNGVNVYANGILSNGQIVLDGTLSATSMLMNNGTLSGNGTVMGLVQNNGVLSPGSSSGEISIDGDVEASGESVMEIEIGGEMPVMEHDRVRVTKTMLLDGALEVTLIDGGMGVFEPNKGDEFEILSANGGIQGTFSSVSLPPLPAALGWQLFYEPTAVSLAVLPRIGGDYDADGDVDRGDLAIWQNGLGTLTGASQTDGDGDGDGDVDGDDLIGLLLNFGGSPNAALASSPAGVPEPSTAVAAGIFVLGAVGRRRLSRRRIAQAR